jgi:hypothetical protein
MNARVKRATHACTYPCLLSPSSFAFPFSPSPSPFSPFWVSGLAFSDRLVDGTYNFYDPDCWQTARAMAYIGNEQVCVCGWVVCVRVCVCARGKGWVGYDYPLLLPALPLLLLCLSAIYSRSVYTYNERMSCRRTGRYASS